jgi:hypothetical protein
MTGPREPMRWADLGADGPPQLAHDIRVMRGERASAPQLASLERRLGPQLAAPTFGRASSATTGIGAKLLVSLAITCAVGVAVLVRPQHDASRAPAASQRPRRPAPPAAPAPQVARVPADDGIAPAPAPAPVPSPVAGTVDRRRTGPRPADRDVVVAPAPESELALLRRAQGALDGDPAAALALTDQHARDYPRGLFAQEREVLAIEALLKLRRKPAAVDRAAQFMRSFAQSPHARRVRALL